MRDDQFSVAIHPMAAADIPDNQVVILPDNLCMSSGNEFLREDQLRVMSSTDSERKMIQSHGPANIAVLHVKQWSR
jgi:hypothetical protein